MHTLWSQQVQGPWTLYLSRQLRFHDLFAAQYQSFFALDRKLPLRILEIGCGPGALCGALHRWYPQAEVIGLDRDSEFIRFARAHEPGVTFMEGDATSLPFPDAAFDVTISNTVSEHIEPGAFYGEQRRVLRDGGICLVLSARKGILQSASCLADSPFEQAFWDKLAACDNTLERCGVCRYPMNEAQLPAALEAHGFEQVTAGYALANLTPDNPALPPELAAAMVEAHRANALEAIDAAFRCYPDVATAQDTAEMKRLTHAKFDARLRDLSQGVHHWDTTVSLTMMIRGIKGASPCIISF